ncbi:MAG TPA: N-acetylmuramoyl-L-alanine amidase [Pseudonocardia sp.]|nr:N-acetylmuramoyl-L-alanine amidase [Pseudonocardia sp.]
MGPLSRRGLLLGGLTLAGGGLLAGGLGLDEAWAIDGPTIISCDGWGSRRNRGVLPVYDRRPVKILVHHTATPNAKVTTRDAAVRLARSIQNFHMDRRGWPDTGQHFTVSRGGIVLEGRHRSLEFVRVGRWQVEGAHCTGQNVVAIGIENEGTYTAVNPPGVLWEKLRSLCAYLCGQYRIRPTQIFGHRDFKDTACPGDKLYAALPRLRSEVAGLLGQKLKKATVDPVAWPLLRIADRGQRVLAAQHLLRAAGVPGIVPDGRFTRELADAVRAFQAERGFGRDDPDLDSGDGPNGMIGGETWPALARPVRAGEGGEAQQAVEVLLRGRNEPVPDVVTPEIWQRLLAP